MNLKQLFATKNECYISGKTHVPFGVLWHSTGANNPNLKRYVGPDDGELGKNQYNNHWNNPRPDGIQKCCHGFIGKLDNGSIATYQILPWNMVGWNSGTGHLGVSKNANNTGYIQIEICEDGLSDAAYFKSIYQESIELGAYLTKEFNLSIDRHICHSEGFAEGIASNHGDVMHWFPKFGKSMDIFRADILAAVNKSSTASTGKVMYGVVKQVIALSTKESAQKYADQLNKNVVDINREFYKVVEVQV